MNLVSNDSTADNSPAIAECVRHALPLPAGVFYCRTMIDTGVGVGGALLGIGATDTARGDGAWRSQPVTVLVWNGEPGGTMLRIRRGRFRLSDVGLVGKPQPTNSSAAGTGTLVEITQRGADWPVGCISFDRVTFACAERGIYIAPGSHGDHISYTDCVSSRVAEPLVIQEHQSVEHTIRNWTAKGGGRTLINCLDGGRLSADVTLIGPWDNLLSLGSEKQKVGPTKNNGHYRIQAWLDNSARIGCAVRECRAYEWGAAVVDITGFAASEATLGLPVQLNGRSRISVNVERVYG